jgi:hypothetical protein
MNSEGFFTASEPLEGLIASAESLCDAGEVPGDFFFVFDVPSRSRQKLFSKPITEATQTRLFHPPSVGLKNLEIKIR